MAVNSVTEKKIDLLGDVPVEGYLALNGCTNFGGRTFVAVPSGSCSSEATGQSAGMVALLESYAREQGLTAHPSLPGAPGTNVLTANEVMQIVRTSADDIDFSTPTAVDPANNFGTPSGSPLLRHGPLPDHAGLGRHLRLRPHQRLRDAEGGARPAHPARGDDRRAHVVRRPAGHGHGRGDGEGRGGAGHSYDYRVEWAPGLQPPLYPATDTWRVRRAGPGWASRRAAGWRPSTSPRSPRRCPTTARGRPSTRPRPARRGALRGPPPGRRHRPRRPRRRPHRRDAEAGLRARRPDLVGPATPPRARRPGPPARRSSTSTATARTSCSWPPTTAPVHAFRGPGPEAVGFPLARRLQPVVDHHSARGRGGHRRAEARSRVGAPSSPTSTATARSRWS